jgi:uncharacterized membrane protein SpoIIM required for sporulation
MKQSFFESQNTQFWLGIENTIDVLQTEPKRLSQSDLMVFVENYRLLCQHLALAQSRSYSPNLIDYLQKLSEQSYAFLYQKKPHLLQQLYQFVSHDFPKLIHQEKSFFIWGHLLFYVPFFACFLMVWLNPNLADTFLGKGVVQQSVDSFQEMSNSHAKGVNREFSQDMIMFAFYIWHNIGIAFKAFAGGIFLGIGTIYTAISNGYIIGGVMGYMAHQPPAKAFFSFVVAHGSFELTGIVLATSGGLKMGIALLFPKGFSRLESLKKEGKAAGQFMGAAFVFLFIAAIIEGFWSPLTTLPYALKFAVGTCLWLIVYYYLFMAYGRRRS